MDLIKFRKHYFIVNCLTEIKFKNWCPKLIITNKRARSYYYIFLLFFYDINLLFYWLENLFNTILSRYRHTIRINHFSLLTHWRKLLLSCLSLTQLIEPMRWFIRVTFFRQKLLSSNAFNYGTFQFDERKRNKYYPICVCVLYINLYIIYINWTS